MYLIEYESIDCTLSQLNNQGVLLLQLWFNYPEIEMKVAELLFLILEALIPGSLCGMIPGKGCGGDIPIKIVDSLGPEDDIANMECVFVQDETNFQKMYLEKTPGTVFYYVYIWGINIHIFKFLMAPSLLFDYVFIVYIIIYFMLLF